MEDWLQKIVDDDDLGLLDVKPKNVRITADERLVKSFEEINKFIEENKREPELSNDILENSLYYRLEGIREDNNKINQLKEFDTFGLLKETEETPQPQSIDDILNDDDLGLLSTPKEDDIFNLGHGLKKVDRSVGDYDYVARAKKCEDFDKFEPLFKACQADLKNGKRRLMKFTTETSIKEGAFWFIVECCYILIRLVIFLSVTKENKPDFAVSMKMGQNLTYCAILWLNQCILMEKS